ncbi:MAG: SpoVA/SpoVAEb family sporulation membrane protein [Bacteroidales bacterium]|nr:SpoVA/SpoVAEb family sporulation membrane protein [Bacteroidales bacterium]
MTEEEAPASDKKTDTVKAFLIGGAICTAGQVLLTVFSVLGAGKEDAAAWTSVVLILAGSLATGTGWYSALAKHGGAGTLIPITGFSNAVCSAAVEAQSEGLIFGVGTKIFTIAGPVILYGTAASVIYGLVYYLTGLV